MLHARVMTLFLAPLRTRTRALGVFFACVVLTATGTAFACRFAPPDRFVEAANPSDTTPPVITEASVFDLVRGSDGQGCRGRGNSCADIARLVLDLEGTDDVSARADLGFRVRVVEGSLPNGTVPVAYTADVSVRPFQVAWAERDAESFDAVLEIVAVDRAGNESAPRRLAVDGGGLACSASNGGFGAVLGFAPLALVLALIARRARRRR